MSDGKSKESGDAMTQHTKRDDELTAYTVAWNDGHPTLEELVPAALAVCGAEMTEAARQRAYDRAGTPHGLEWALRFQAAYIAELRNLLESR